jgi:hypothetical protein
MKMKKSPGRCRILVVVSEGETMTIIATEKTLSQCVREEYRGYAAPLLSRTWVHIPDGPKCPARKRAQIIREVRRWWWNKRHQWTSSYRLGRVYPCRAKRTKLVGHWGPVVVGCAVIDTEQSHAVERENFQMTKGVS